MGRGGAYKRERSSCNAARTFFHKEKSPYRQINSNIHAFWSILLKLKMCNKIPTFGSKHRKPTDGYIRQQWIRLKEIIYSLVQMKALMYCWVCILSILYFVLIKVILTTILLIYMWGFFTCGKHLHNCIISIRGLGSAYN